MTKDEMKKSHHEFIEHDAEENAYEIYAWEKHGKPTWAGSNCRNARYKCGLDRNEMLRMFDEWADDGKSNEIEVVAIAYDENGRYITHYSARYSTIWRKAENGEWSNEIITY